MGEGFITRRGGTAVGTAAPSINFVSKTSTEIVFTLTNNDTATADLFWEIDDTTPDANTLSLAGGATSGNFTVSGLTQGTEYIIYAFANIEGKAASDTATLTQTTDSFIYTNATSGDVVQSLSLQFISGSQYRTDDGSIQSFGSYHRTEKIIVPASIISINSTSNIHQMMMWDVNDVYLGAYSRTATGTGLNNYTTVTPKVVVQGMPSTTMILYPGTAKIGFSAANINYSDNNESISAISYATFQQLTANYVINPAPTVEYNLNGKRYRSHTFTQNGTFVVTQVGTDPTVDYLIIAGGGSSAGGAGGYRTTNGTSGGNSSPETKPNVALATYPIYVGAGNAVLPEWCGGRGGMNSTAFGITSVGGGGGGCYIYGSELFFGHDGGSGGGSALVSGTPRAGGSGIAGQGFAGGTRTSGGGMAGGGGAGGAGQNAPGHGGPGLSSVLRTGSAEFRAGGGGGGHSSSGSVGTGGTGGGGNGSTACGVDGVVNTGGGGGGGYFGGCPGDGFRGQGASGIIIIRYEIEPV